MRLIHSVCLVAGLIELAATLPVGRCHKRQFAYYMADSKQCDKYYKCEDGQLTDQLCADGLVYDKESQSCFMMQRISCKGRPDLRRFSPPTLSRQTCNIVCYWYVHTYAEPATSNDKCQRLNGRFPIHDKCGVYYECTDGVALVVNCSTNLVYDINQAVCEFADIANRTGCLAEDILGFQCPRRRASDGDGDGDTDKQVSLQFGDHERLPKVRNIF